MYENGQKIQNVAVLSTNFIDLTPLQTAKWTVGMTGKKFIYDNGTFKMGIPSRRCEIELSVLYVTDQNITLQNAIILSQFFTNMRYFCCRN